ncbi:hypothetical protein N7522_001772 [Penicillium canescens]|nr:hypothetical protein N7522_001772 [Penicillium canescens]
MAETSVTVQTTEVGVIDIPFGDYWKPLVGSVLATNDSLTTLEVNCHPSMTASCSTYGGLPVYLTLGPSTQERLAQIPSVQRWTERCEITSSTKGALCETTVS